MTEPSDPVASLWRFDGTVSRQTYAFLGFIGFAIKHNIDRVIARDYLYGINGLLNYWARLNKAARLAHLHPRPSRIPNHSSRGYRRRFQNPLIIPFVLRDHIIRAKFLLRVQSRRMPHLAPAIRA
jgi:hypothetical protein